MLRNAAVAEPLNLANGGEFHELRKGHDPERSRPSRNVPNAGTPGQVVELADLQGFQ
jgi:hypothetical protein